MLRTSWYDTLPVKQNIRFFFSRVLRTMYCHSAILPVSNFPVNLSLTFPALSPSLSTIIPSDVLPVWLMYMINMWQLQSILLLYLSKQPLSMLLNRPCHAVKVYVRTQFKRISSSELLIFLLDPTVYSWKQIGDMCLHTCMPSIQNDISVSLSSQCPRFSHIQSTLIINKEFRVTQHGLLQDG